MKTRLYWSYATRSLARGGQRTLLAIGCVAVGVLAIVALQLVINGIGAGISANARQINGGDIVVNSYNAAVPLGVRQLAVLNRLKAQGTIADYTTVDAQNAQVRGLATSVHLIAMDPARFPLAGGAIVTAPGGGRLPTLLHGTMAVVTTPLAGRLNLTVGDRLHFSAGDGRAGTVTVGGIVASSGVLQGPVLLIARDAYARFPSATGQPIVNTDLYVDVDGHSGARAARAAALLRRTFPLAAVTTTMQVVNGYRSQIASGRTFVQIVGLLALLIGGVGIMNTMQVTLRRRRTEIAMLKASGYRRRDLYALFGLEAVLIGLVGGVAGATAGGAVSVLIKGTMESLFGILWPTTIDARTLAEGIALGAGTALIFGLWPIVQASELRPQAVLRGLAEGTGRASRWLTVALAALLVVLFVALAAGILGNLAIAVEAIGGIGIVLAVLGLICALAVVAMGALPVPGAFRARAVLPAGAALLIAAAVTVALPALGALLLVAAALSLLVVLIPGTWRWAVKLALRRIGRQRARAVATLLALSVGVFSIGLVLTLGQDIRTVFAQRLYGHVHIDVTVLVAGQGNRATVEQLLTRTPGMANEGSATLSQARPIAVAGRPFDLLARAALATGKYRTFNLIGPLDGVLGHDLAGRRTPDLNAYTIVRGIHDRRAGRTLTARDAGTRHALLPVAASGAPLNLRLGDTVAVEGPAARMPITLNIVGFYTSNVNIAPIQVDNSVVSQVANGHLSYLFYAYLPPDRANTTLDRIQRAVPAASVSSSADALDSATGILDRAILVLAVIASLALLAGIVLVASTVALALLERRRELGILKAVGYTSRGVLGAVLVENGAIGVAGALLAMLLVAAIAPLLGRAMYNQPFSVPVPLMLAAIPATAVACMVVAGAVAWRPMRVRPLDVLRYE